MQRCVQLPMGHQAKTDDRILTEAARWQARLAAEDCTDLERATFQRWKSASPEHARAYGLADSLSARITELASADSRLQSLADEAFELGGDDQAHALPGSGGRARRWPVPASLAAAVLVAVSIVRLPDYLGGSTPPLTYSSTGHARRDVTLSDGSLVHLDVGSEIEVAFSQSQRRVELVEGRALFEVAHDATKPFVVSAGESTTTALGTHFQVQREGQEVLVTLTEGSIAVASESEQTGWRERLVPGEQVSLSVDGKAHSKRLIDAQAATSWSRGRLVFRGTPLGEALREVNRYGNRKVRLGDPDLAGLPVGGNFIAGETDLIVSAFAAAMPLRLVQGSGDELIIFRRYETDAP
jgi:transmembrane sensor